MKKGKTVAFKLNGKMEENKRKTIGHKQTDTPDTHTHAVEIDVREQEQTRKTTTHTSA